jgi:hypothetical protein
LIVRTQGWLQTQIVQLKLAVTSQNKSIMRCPVIGRFENRPATYPIKFDVNLYIAKKTGKINVFWHCTIRRVNMPDLIADDYQFQLQERLIFHGKMHGASMCNRSVALARSFREVFLKLAFFAIKFLGVFRRIALDGDVWPFVSVFGVEPQPFFEARLGVRLDRFRRTFRLTNTAINAFIGMDHEHVFALVETIYGTDFHAVHVFALDAVVVHDIGQASAPEAGVLILAVCYPV